MIFIDSREPDFVYDMFDKLGIPFEKKELSFKGKKFGDFTNEVKSFVVERKRTDDFYHSMVDGRLYDQLQKINSRFDSNKYIMLEGYDIPKYFEDSNSFFDEYDKRNRELKEKSPMQQIIEAHPDKRKWIWGQIKLVAEYDISFLQTFNLRESCLFVEQLDAGSRSEPSLRKSVKQIKKFSLERNILMLFDNVAEKRSAKILNEFGSLPELITQIRESNNPKLDKYKMFRDMKKVFKDENSDD